MCGIVGMVARREVGFYYKDSEFLEQALFADALRGDDSTGLFGVRKSGNVDIIKEASPSYSFISTKEYGTFQEQVRKSHRAVIGHNRKATKGSIDDKNAHPFYEGDVTLVHNGTLFDHGKLKEGVAVDSHAICHAINDSGHTDAINRIDGAYALAWYDNRDRTLRLARNKERPLSIIETDDMYYIASEPSMLYWILGRNGVDLRDDKAKLILLEVGKLYEFDLSARKIDLEIKDLGVPEVASDEKKSQPSSSPAPQQVAAKGESTSKESKPEVSKTSLICLPQEKATKEIAFDVPIVFKFEYWETKADAEKESPFMWSSIYAGNRDCRFIGTSAAHKGVTFIGYTNEANVSQLLKDSCRDLLVGKVVGIVKANGKPNVVSLLDIEASGMEISKNGLIILPVVWASIDHTCDVCKTKVGRSEISTSNIEYISNSVGDVLTYRKKRIECPTCAKVK